MRTYILSDSERVASRVQLALLRVGIDTPGECVWPLVDCVQLPESDNDVVILCLSPDPEQAIRALDEGLSGRRQRVLAVGPGTDPKLILRTLRAGAAEFVMEDELETELSAVLGRLQGATRSRVGRTLAVLGTSGGCGASTVTVNLAAALGRESDGCILVDLKLETGDLADLLDLRPKHTIADLCGGYTRPDRQMFEQSLVSHSCGIQLLASPRRQASSIRARASLGPGVTGELVRELLSLARTIRPHTLVEVNTTFREEQVEALRFADQIFLVLRLDYTSFKNAKRLLDHLDHFEIDRSRVRLIGNRHGQPHALPPKYAEESLGMPFFHLIPDDPQAMNVSTNVGEPAVLGLPRSPSSRSLVKLAESLSGLAG
jgi:pilus assembly protein CpaE